MIFLIESHYNPTGALSTKIPLWIGVGVDDDNEGDEIGQDTLSRPGIYTFSLWQRQLLMDRISNEIYIIE